MATTVYTFAVCALLVQIVGGTITVPKVGLIVENTEVAVHTLQDVYHTLVFHVGVGTNRTFSQSCHWASKDLPSKEVMDPLWNLVGGYQQVAITGVCDASPLLCDQHWIVPPKARPKRFVGLLGAMAGFAGVGLALKNRVRLENLEGAIQTVGANQLKISNFLASQGGNISAELHKLESLVLARSSNFQITVDRLSRRVCEMERGYAQAFLGLNSRLMLDEAFDIVERAQRGDIDPRMVPLSIIRDMTSPGGALVRTVYESDPDLFYALTTPYLVSHDRTKGTIVYVLQTPKIVPSDISPVYSIYNHGFKDSRTGLWMAVQVPDRFFTLTDSQNGVDKRIPIPLDNARCFHKGAMLICRHEVPEITNASLCLHNLLERKSAARCHLRELPMVQKIVVQVTHSALILRGVDKYTTTQTVRGIPKTQDHYINGSNMVIVPHTEYTTVMAGGHVIVSPLQYDTLNAYQLPYVVPPVRTVDLTEDGFDSHAEITRSGHESSVILWKDRIEDLKPILPAHPVSLMSLVAFCVSGFLGLVLLLWLSWYAPRWILLIRRRREVAAELSKLTGKIYRPVVQTEHRDTAQETSTKV